VQVGFVIQMQADYVNHHVKKKFRLADSKPQQ
jgi:hypothetical protein